MTKARDLGDNAQNTKPKVVNAKADLIVGTGSDAADRLAVGSNGETLVADDSQTTGLRYNAPVGSLGNPQINGGMDVWQRGTSFTATSGYTADRWFVNHAAAGRTVSRQTTSDTTNLPNIQFCLRYQRDSGNTNTNNSILYSSWETTNSLPFAGKTVTLSFYARRGANFSGASNQLSVYLITGTGTDQNYGVGYTGGAFPINNQKATLTTTWQRFAFTGTIASTATEISTYFEYTPVGTAGAADHFEITGVQLDVGTWTASTAPTFRRSGNTLAGERSACERYFYRTTFNKHFTPVRDTNIFWFQFKNPTTMRTAPSVTTNLTTKVANDTGLTATQVALYYGSFLSGTATITLGVDSTSIDEVSVYFTGATVTQGTFPTAALNGGYFDVSAEL